MAKAVTQFVCQACGTSSPKWIGRCTGCGEWNSLVEEARPAKRASTGGGDGFRSAAQPVSAIDPDHAARLRTGISELDRVLGGGAVLGGVTLVGGDPGV